MDISLELTLKTAGPSTVTFGAGSTVTELMLAPPFSGGRVA